jgi:murein DD-endopeptidase MepM/ murein hydrolase activator NlpD
MVSLSLDPPPYTREGRGNRRNPRHSARRFFVTAFCVALLAAGFVAGRWTAPGGRFPITWTSRLGHPAEEKTASEPARAAQASAPAAASTPAAVAAQPGAPAPSSVKQPSAAPAALVPAPPAAAPTSALPPGPRRIVVTLNGPMEEAILAAVPPTDRGIASELTQVVNRLLVWNLRVSRDGRRGDKLQIVYHPPGGAAAISDPGANEPVVDAIRYDSQKLSAVIAAYRFQAPGARWARYYRPDGSELEERLVDSPTPEYDQITSLLRDGRRHKGIDFRQPVGTPVLATFDGVIERRNWNFAGNGNCLDVRDTATGRHAIFLHLDVLPKDMAPGRQVKKGEQIASSGNSGHSFAPHLHYQLESADGTVLDPFDVQPTRRAALDTGARTAFELERARLDAALTGSAVAKAGAEPAAPPAPAPAPAAAR